MEDEELLDLLLEGLYLSGTSEIDSINHFLNMKNIGYKKKQLRRIMTEIKNNDFALVSEYEDDYAAQISPEGLLYCEEVLMLKS